MTQTTRTFDYPSVLNGTADMTHDDIAEVFGISRKRVQQIEQRAFEKIRAAIVAESQAEGVSVKEWLFG